MTDTILVDGVDFESEFRHIRFTGWGDMHTVAAPRGGNYEVPGRSGEVWREKPRAASVHSLGWSITPDGSTVPELMARANAEWFALVSLFPRRRPVTVTRVLDVWTPDGVVEMRHEALMERVDAVAPNWVAHSYQDGFLTLRNMDGCWFDEDVSSFDLVSGSNFVPVSGSTDTSSVQVELRVSAEGTQTLTNVSTGVSFSYMWTADRVGSTVVVDASAFTVYRYPTPGSDTRFVSLSAFLNSGDSRFMVLDPGVGVNELTLSMGSASLSYRGAWL